MTKNMEYVCAQSVAASYDCYSTIFPTRNIIVDVSYGKVCVYHVGRINIHIRPFNFCLEIKSEANSTTKLYNI